MVLKGVHPVRTKISTDNQPVEQIINISAVWVATSTMVIIIIQTINNIYFSI